MEIVTHQINLDFGANSCGTNLQKIAALTKAFLFALPKNRKVTLGHAAKSSRIFCAVNYCGLALNFPEMLPRKISINLSLNALKLGSFLTTFVM